MLSGLAPAGAFTLDVTGQVGIHVTSQAAPRSTLYGWAPAYQVSSTEGAVTGQLVLHQFPYNGLLALLTLALWTLAWLGFGWVHRLEWLFTRRSRTASAGRHVRRETNE